MPRILEHRLRWLRVERHGIYAIGSSMGGQETLLLDALHPHLLAGAVALDSATNMAARWRAYLSRWQDEFPGLSDGCRKAMPQLERCYGQLIRDLTEKLTGDEDSGLENDFALQEFLDRYGMRLAQLGTILNLVAPLAEAGSQNESA